MSTSDFNVRFIQADDNAEVKTLVQNTLAEFGLVGAGYAGVDDELNDMYQSYSDDLSAYYVIVSADKIYGVGGFAPLTGTERGTIAELRKMYFLPSLRGQGMGQQLIQLCLKEATKLNYKSMYLETVPKMKAAQALYLKNGFEYLEQRLGNTGHSNCGVHMLRKLND
ncbi:GNAT family N-acetyltransferase [Marinicella litoralis]|uniref:Putative acetyltransferase n=1 Tax=Marinicella litoralis TaxID=644220 RepID=A0A4R6XKE6_9GAMM|nr:GNAT family N-acetyltransferase [Marinicella litoralis]TDR18450.1 putative acetyltransferase [Marinicella litoralis]